MTWFRRQRNEGLDSQTKTTAKESDVSLVGPELPMAFVEGSKRLG